MCFTLGIGRPNRRDESENSFHAVSSRYTHKGAFLNRKLLLKDLSLPSSREACEYLISVQISMCDLPCHYFFYLRK